MSEETQRASRTWGEVYGKTGCQKFFAVPIDAPRMKSFLGASSVIGEIYHGKSGEIFTDKKTDTA